MQNTTHTKLLAIRERRKRWQTRLTRASNMLAKLAKQEARLLKTETPLPKLLQGIAAADVPAWTDKNCVKPLDIPPEFKRVQEIKETKGMIPAGPLLTAAMQPTRKRQGTDAERKRMPLNDREALAALKAKSAEVTARRAKRER